VDPKQGNRDVVVHGFRSSFRDWAAETTNFPNFVCEMALAHAVEDDVEAAYRRGDLLEKRKLLIGSLGELLRLAASWGKGRPDPQRVKERSRMGKIMVDAASVAQTQRSQSVTRTPICPWLCP